MKTEKTLQTNIKSIASPEFYEKSIAWCLDYPRPGKLVTDDDRCIEVRGWILVHDYYQLQLVIRHNGVVTRYSLTEARPDVIEKVLTEIPLNHTQLFCGFSISLDVDENTIDLGFLMGGEEHWVTHISFSYAHKVMLGMGNHLFLDNDTNRSVDQYQGKVLISSEELNKWEEYFSQISNHHSGRWAFLIAPAKEFVVSESYPYKRAAVTPVEQILQRFENFTGNIVYPIDELKAQSHITYSTGDTHWTDYGAFIAAQKICTQLGIVNSFPSKFPPFSLNIFKGDLISKVDPEKKYLLYEADFSREHSRISFSNHLWNHGRICIYENGAASTNCSAVLFGDSFSNNMVPWLSLVFKRLLFVHTAGAIDNKIINQEMPDFIILQSNSRFLTSAPHYGIHVDKVISGKLELLNSAEKAELHNRVINQEDSIYRSWMLSLLDA